MLFNEALFLILSKYLSSEQLMNYKIVQAHLIDLCSDSPESLKMVRKFSIYMNDINVFKFLLDKSSSDPLSKALYEFNSYGISASDASWVINQCLMAYNKSYKTSIPLLDMKQQIGSTNTDKMNKPNSNKRITKPNELNVKSTTNNTNELSQLVRLPQVMLRFDLPNSYQITEHYSSSFGANRGSHRIYIAIGEKSPYKEKFKITNLEHFAYFILDFLSAKGMLFKAKIGEFEGFEADCDTNTPEEQKRFAFFETNNHYIAISFTTLKPMKKSQINEFESIINTIRAY
ncbi:hypothetical protein N7548_01525 [Acholeplasma manati]|uniref:WYL domain-containing protein n=1 Tax=Paracholeplasma manati TaxID=591373 RepID=A0ABT2Y4X1_9MOLU|nr:hypothetical protein [Paracholeplasma manati]MCV2231508.1 hypothetical protein [Paracholeplasma manati]